MKVNGKKVTKNKLFALAMAAVVMLSVILPMAPVSAAPMFGPVAVNGRILTPDKTGDISNWVEIAQYGNYSLIVRANFINLTGYNYGNPTWQSMIFGTTNKYMESVARNKINHWFSGVPDYANWEDVLFIGARLRNYTMQHNAVGVLGSCNTLTSLYDGLSLPTPYQVGIGNDIAFVLSYSECANFLSNIYFQRNNNLADQPSNFFAATNVLKIHMPDPTPAFSTMWLRSPGDIANTIGSLSSEGRGRYRAFQSYANNVSSNYGLIYPALWVNADIFGSTIIDYEVTYYPNGGTGSVNSYPAQMNTNHLVVDQGYTNGSLQFTGWNTQANGSGTWYQNYDVINVTGNVNLYAQWGRPPSSVIYHSNGSSDADYIDYGTGGTFTIKAGIFSRPQYFFVGWNTSPDGSGAILPPGLTFSNFVGNLHLYAIWAFIN